MNETFNISDVNLGYLEGDIHRLAHFIAVENGYYGSISVNTVPLGNGNDVMTAFESVFFRSIDMSYLGFAPAIVHRLNTEGADITVVAGANSNGTAIIVKNDAGITQLTDLEGLTIAVPSLNNMQDFILRLAYEDAGITYENQDIVTLSPADMITALEGGSIDGYVAWEPHNARAVAGDDPSGKYLVNSSELWPNHPCCVIAAHNDFLQAKPAIVKAIVSAHVQATDWLNNPANLDDAVDIAIEKLGISSEQEALIAMRNVGYIYEPDISKMVEFLDKLVTYGTVPDATARIPEGITTHTQIINYFVNTTLLNQITST